MITRAYAVGRQNDRPVALIACGTGEPPWQTSQLCDRLPVRYPPGLYPVPGTPLPLLARKFLIPHKTLRKILSSQDLYVKT